MLNSYELVRNTIARKDIDRLPVCYFALGISDINEFFMKNPKKWHPKKVDTPFDFWNDFGSGKKRKDNIVKEDEWGCLWGVTKGIYGLGEVIEHPLENIDDINNYNFPEASAAGRFDGLSDFINKNVNKYIVFTNAYGIFERLHFLHGFTNTLRDLVIDFNNMEYILDNILNFHLELIELLGKQYKNRVHQYRITDDWGMNNGLFISPNLWRKVFKPRYLKIAEKAHLYNMDFLIHSDGNLYEIIEDFIEIGVDVLDLPQPSSIYGIKKFGKRFGGRIGFHAYTDIQTTAVTGSKEKIIKESQEMMEYWSAENASGLIAVGYPDIGSIGSSTLKQKISLKSFKQAFKKKLEKYQRK